MDETEGKEATGVMSTKLSESVDLEKQNITVK